jgi:DOPA 4,5-dioxygenase
MSDEERVIQNTEEDQEWADLLSPMRRKFIIGAGLTAAGLTAENIEVLGQEMITPAGLSFKPIVPPPDIGKSPWGYETYKEPTPQPRSCGYSAFPSRRSASSATAAHVTLSVLAGAERNGRPGNM